MCVCVWFSLVSNVRLCIVDLCVFHGVLVLCVVHSLPASLNARPSALKYNTAGDQSESNSSIRCLDHKSC